MKSKTFSDVLVPYFALNSIKRLHDLVVARGMLESEIAGLAALQRTDEDLASLIEILEYNLPPEAPTDDVAFLQHKRMSYLIDTE